MLFWLVKHALPWLEAHGMGFFRVFTREQDPFRQVLAIVLSFFTVVLLGPRVIAALRNRKIGDTGLTDAAKLEDMSKSKAGTPTMGGVLIIGAIVAATLLLADLTNFYVIMALVCVVLLGGVGATDDWLKLNAARNQAGRQGLTSREKLLFQVGLAVVLALFTYRYGQELDSTRTLYFPFFKNLKPQIGLAAFTVIGVVVLTGSSNAVNLTDGMDGLAAGCMGIVSFTFFLLALISSQVALASKLFLPPVPFSEDLSVIAGAMTGACLGFLWFNCNPARVFMGDTGSLALGGLIGYIALVLRQEFLLVFVGGIFVLEAVSVLLQVSYFKFTRKRFGEGRRIFLCAPIHHHFRQKGWTESQVVVRFWLLNAMLAAMALATVKLR